MTASEELRKAIEAQGYETREIAWRRDIIDVDHPSMRRCHAARIRFLEWRTTSRASEIQVLAARVLAEKNPDP